jgi:hypothetical protein
MSSDMHQERSVSRVRTQDTASETVAGADRTAKAQLIASFCDKCSSFLECPLEFDQRFEDYEPVQELWQTTFISHHSNYKNLSQSSENGCPICFLVTRFLDSDPSSPNADLESLDLKFRRECWLYNPLQLNSITVQYRKKGSNDPGSHFLGEIVRIPDYPPELPFSESTSSINLESWLSTCLTEHTCDKDRLQGYLPVRLLECNESSVRLIDSVSLDSSKDIRFAALSHCWGVNPSHVILTVKNIKNLQDGMDLKSLPLTFSQAAQITHNLNINYLWIDSICIIQSGDEGKDWLHHLHEMSNIYSSCVLQISASHSTDANGGCFSIRPSAASNPVILPPANFHNLQAEVADAFEPGLLLPSSDPFLHFKLTSRGWVYQERLLSPRTAHFDTFDVFWECNEYTTSASFMLGNKSLLPYLDRASTHYTRPEYSWRPPTLQNPLSNQTAFFSYPKWDWRSHKNFDFNHYESLIADYSTKKLTRPEDRLIAFSGVARKFCEHFEDKYIAGFCLSMLPQSLLWRAASCVIDQSQPLFDAAQHLTSDWAPTWSWGSFLSPIEPAEHRYAEIHKKSHSKYSANVVGTEVQLVDPSNEYGPIKNASITLDAPTFCINVRSLTKTALNTIYLENTVLNLDYMTDGAAGTRSKARSIMFAKDSEGIMTTGGRRHNQLSIYPDWSANYADIQFWKNALFVVIKANSLETQKEDTDVAEFDSRTFSGLVLIPVSTKTADGPPALKRLGTFILNLYSASKVGMLSDLRMKQVMIW